MRPRPSTPGSKHLASALLGAWLAVSCLAFPVRLGAQFAPVTVLDDDQAPVRINVGSGGVRELGQTLASAGDANGDGVPDLLVVASGAGMEAPGRVYLVPRARQGSHLRELAPGVDGVVEFRSGLGVPDPLGAFAAGVGDVDQDGLDDFLLGVPVDAGPNLPRGGVFLVFGSQTFFPQVTLRNPATTRSILFRWNDLEHGFLGLSGDGAGDVNDDGYPDIVLGLPEVANGPGGPGGPGGPDHGPGRAFVIFGGPALAGVQDTIDLDTLPAALGFSIEGVEEGSAFGAAVAGAGDLDADGVDDLALGAPLQGEGTGRGGSVFIVFGRAGLDVGPDLVSADPESWVELRALVNEAQFGEALAGALDTTGDGIPDLLVGAPGLVRDGGLAGGAYLVSLGGAAHATSTRMVPSNGDWTLRASKNSGAGRALALVPDADGDDLDDLVLGAPQSRSGRGAAYLVRGGRPAGQELLLEQIEPPDGWIFLADGLPLQVGAAVAGLPDSNGDALGDLALGAPGLPWRGLPGAGGVFEVFLPADPQSPAPRNHVARVIPGGRVLLTWMIAGEYEYLRVLRNGEPISSQLFPRTLSYVDTSPGSGRIRYEVEANGDESLRSQRAEVLVRSIPVRDLQCRQVEGQNRVRASWVSSDVYEALQVFADGVPASGLLPRGVSSHEFDLAPGEHVIEVFDPISVPEGARARCTVTVRAPQLPGIEGFSCESDSPGTVRLAWEPDAAYSSYLISREGVFLALVTSASEYLDLAVPPGRTVYELRGVNVGLHRGPIARCEREVQEQGGVAFVEGLVTWRDGSRVRRGLVRVFDGFSAEVSRAQLDLEGHFRAPVPAPGDYLLAYEVDFSLEVPALAQVLPSEGFRLVVERAAASGSIASIELPPPVILLAARNLGPEEFDAAARWDPLREALGVRVTAVPVVVPGGTARGSSYLVDRIDDVIEALEDALGSKPPRVDVVAHGAAGLAARAATASLPRGRIGQLWLLGTPNLGTRRARIEAQAELSARPPRPLDLGDRGPRDDGPPDDAGSFAGASEQTPEFLAEFNSRFQDLRGASAHLVAGTSGLSVLDPILGCESHDNRVCEESALGGLVGAATHQVAENHESLGRAAASMALLLDAFSADGAEGGGGGELAEADAGGAASESGYPVGDGYTGVLEPGATGSLPMVSDTSESMIIILSTDLPSGIRFEVRTPSGIDVDPPSAGALPAVEYQSYGDGAGHQVQVYRFSPCEPGTYLVFLENEISNPAERYTLESYVAGDFSLEVSLVPEEARLEDEIEIQARFLREGAPELGAGVEVRIGRPDGSVEIADLHDDGVGADAFASDGVYSDTLSTGGQPGIHQIVASAVSAEPALAEFRLESFLSLRVWSDAARFTEDFAQGAEDSGEDGILDYLWVDLGLESAEGGIFFVLGRLEDEAGSTVAEAGTAFRLDLPGTATTRLFFLGADLHASGRNGPYRLAELTILDGSAGYVPADRRFDVLETPPHAWTEFAPPDATLFVRGDANGDGRTDISDGVAVLGWLFSGDAALDCLDAADTNADGALNVTDPLYLFAYLFRGSDPPPLPNSACGAAEVLGCVSFPACR